MTPTLNQTWSKWILYKRMFITFFALNIFCLSVSVVLTFSYWSDISNSPEKVKQLIIIGLITFVFGIILPCYLIYKIGFLLNKARKDLETAARDIAREWMKQFEKYDEEPFKNIDFWVTAALLGAEHFGRYNDHPMANLGGELAGLVRQEISKIKKAS